MTVPSDPTRIRLSIDTPADGTQYRVTAEPIESHTWFQVIEEYHDLYLPRLTTAPLRVMSAMFRHRDRFSGRTLTTRQRLAASLLLSRGSISDALTLLLDHPGRLLAEPEANVFEVMPGRGFKRRKVEPPGVRQAEIDFDRPNDFSAGRKVPLENARAQTRPEEKTEESGKTYPRARSRPIDSPAEGEMVIRALAGWRTSLGGHLPMDLFGERAALRGDVRGLLASLEVREPMLGVVCGVPGLSVLRVVGAARSVWEDRTAERKPICLAARLLSAAGFKLPPRTGPRPMERTMVAAAEALGVGASLEAIRRSRMGGGR